MCASRVHSSDKTHAVSVHAQVGRETLRVFKDPGCLSDEELTFANSVVGCVCVRVLTARVRFLVARVWMEILWRILGAQPKY